MPPSKRTRLASSAPEAKHLAKRQQKTCSWSNFSCNVELLHHSKVKASWSGVPEQLDEFPSRLCALWTGKPPTWWNKMMRDDEDLDGVILRISFRKLATAESVGVFVGDICAGDEGHTSFGLRSLPTKLPESASTDACMGISLTTDGIVIAELMTWDEEIFDIVPFEGQEARTFFDQELPWAATLAWHEYESYF
jgi:hypothetical protein